MQTLLHVAERQEVMEIAWGLSVRILYQGAQFCFLRDVPYTLLFFPSYATLRDARADQPTGKTSMLPIVWAGATTGAGGAVIGTHADVVKSGLGKQRGPYMGRMDCLRKVVEVNFNVSGHHANVYSIDETSSTQKPWF
ncbi:hypothetical protein PInf_010124 [Phytophthora infestans]|nr:hypothetical protein PInf_010124 [Phytophthora infestans]